MGQLRQALRGVRHALARLGPRHPGVLSTMWAYGLGCGFHVVPVSGGIAIRQGRRIMMLRESDFTFVRNMIQGDFDAYFEILEPERVGDSWVLDFSRPRSHHYRRLGVGMLFPGIPEDDDVAAYTRAFTPKVGMTVFDVGAHAGLTAYAFSRMVGSTGCVYAFEPDRCTRQYLEANVCRLGLSNVVICDFAIGDRSGRAAFNMDGSVSAGLLEFLPHPDTGYHEEVEALTLEDTCRRLGQVPQYAKLDIEGAEVAVIESSLSFLRRKPIAFAIASYHLDKHGSPTYLSLEPAFEAVSYRVESSDTSGHMMTYALPPVATVAQERWVSSQWSAESAAPTIPAV